ncbi:MAG: DUF434 domain-containing protein [Planctomycetes bacterium]|nr:DUF434 domain-containing protein [Planctomycetota bacterium]
MPDKRTHRGPHPDDAGLFGTERIEDLRSALADYARLLTKGYANKSALKLVGDHFSLTRRQRLAVMRSACSDQQVQIRRASCLTVADLAGRSIAIDGYNLLITIEAAMSGAPIFLGRDGCLRDLASLHGTYRKVNETLPALKLIGECLQALRVSEVLWWLDSPVSNSGRLKGIIEALAEENGWVWEIRLSTNPDAELKQTDRVVVSGDSVILDHCQRWVNLAQFVVSERLPRTSVVQLAGSHKTK